MECRYCQAANADDEHRCRRCGRRLRMGPVYTGSSAAAPALQYEAAPVFQYEASPLKAAPALRFETLETSTPSLRATSRLEPHATPKLSAPRRPITYQPSLFTSRELPHGGSIRNHRAGTRATVPAQAPASAPRQRRRKLIPGQQALEFTSHFTPVSPVVKAGRWRYLLRCSRRDPRASCDGGRSGHQHYSNGAGYFRNHIPPGGRGIRIERQDLPDVPWRSRRRRDFLQIAVVPRQRRYGRPKVDSSAAGEFRRPDAHSCAAILPDCVGLLELDGRGHRIAVGLGGRRDAHLARSHFQDLPDAGQLMGQGASAWRRFHDRRHRSLAARHPPVRSVGVDLIASELGSRQFAGDHDGAACVIHLHGMVPGVRGRRERTASPASPPRNRRYARHRPAARHCRAAPAGLMFSCFVPGEAMVAMGQFFIIAARRISGRVLS